MTDKKTNGMKKYIPIIVLNILCITLYAQELPKNFRETVQNEYNSISKEQIRTELKMTFDQYYNFRAEEYVDKQKFYKSIVEKSGAKNFSGLNDLCSNGTFEEGDVLANDWNFYWAGSAYAGLLQSGSNVSYTANSGNTRINTGNFAGYAVGYGDHLNQVHHQVQSVGADPTFPALSRVYSFPTGNTKSLRLGNKHCAFGKESVAKVVTITPSNSTLYFSYAFVTENPSGHGNDLPFFEVNIKDAADPQNINYSSLVNLGGGSNRIRADNPLLTPNSTTATTRWKDWSCVTADLSSLMGKTVIIEFNNRDCNQGAHYAYTYLDNICIGCGNAPSNEGSVSIDQGQSDSCGIPGNVCVNYTVPDTNNPSMQITLELIKNGAVINTMQSPYFHTNGSYCFQITNNITNLSGGFDYRIVGHAASGNFTFPDKIIGTAAEGVKPGANNDYTYICSKWDNPCCQVDLAIWNVAGTPDPIPTTQQIHGGEPVTLAIESFELHQNSNIPITEIRVAVTDIIFNYNYESCGKCESNPALWGSLLTATNNIEGLQFVSVPDNSGNATAGNSEDIIMNNKGVRELVWRNPNGAMLHAGTTFSVLYLLPPESDIPCCVTSVTICTKITWKDANCKACEGFTCSNIEIANEAAKVTGGKG